MIFMGSVTSAKYERNATDWTVLPSPISSAKMPLMPYALTCQRENSCKMKGSRKKDVGPTHLFVEIDQPAEPLPLVRLEKRKEWS